MSDAASIERLRAPFGVEARGLDLAAPDCTREEFDALRRAFDDHHLLLLRGPVISGEAQISFVARFGPLIAERGLWGYVSNVREDGIVREGPLLFHSDFAFTQSPVWAISLHAWEVPSSGSTTMFARATADSLPADLRARLDGKRVVNLYDFGRPDDQPMRLAEAAPGSPHTEHPIIRRHPRTGVEVVMANELHTDHVVGVPAAESAALLADLFAALYDDSNTYRHEWSVGDLVLWDNVALHHGRRGFDPAERRTLQRVTLGLHTPSESVPGLADLLAAAHTRLS